MRPNRGVLPEHTAWVSLLAQQMMIQSSAPGFRHPTLLGLGLNTQGLCNGRAAADCRQQRLGYPAETNELVNCLTSESQSRTRAIPCRTTLHPPQHRPCMRATCILQSPNSSQAVVELTHTPRGSQLKPHRGCPKTPQGVQSSPHASAHAHNQQQQQQQHLGE